MAHTELENLLKRAIGLDAASIGSSAIERAVRQRSMACKLEDSNAYWEHVSESEAELQELIEAVIVPETWFFRDREAFAALTRTAQQEWLPAHPEGVLRVLSLPCSTGEEPYSIAMALLDAGFPADRFQIDAVDISRRAITHAERGTYGRNSFRVPDLTFRDRYFEAMEQNYRLGEDARRHVRFQHGNLLASGWLPGVHQYDAIFCRNALIYFDRPTQHQVIEKLGRLLTPAGLLFVGPSEAGLLLDHRFASAGIPLAFAFRKPRADSPEAKPKRVHPTQQRAALRSIPPHAPALAARLPLAKPVLVPTPHPPSQPSVEPELRIDAATRLADQGRMAEAEQCCEEQIREHGPSAQVFYLMGLIRGAAGAVTQAAAYYRKALYLDRDHQEALIHLALLLDKQGDAVGAKLLRNRVQRSKRKIRQ